MLTSNKILGLNSFQWVPDGSKSTDPMLCALFFPGSGEIGTYPTKLLSHGPFASIKATTNLGFNIRVISVQNVNPNPRPSETQMVMDAIRLIYNTPKFVGMGLSRGGQDWDWYISNSEANMANMAGLLICSSQGPVSDTAGIAGTWTPQWFVDNKVPYLFAIGSVDPFYDANKARYNALLKAGATAYWEEWAGVGHSDPVWLNSFDPAYVHPALKMTWPQWMNSLQVAAGTVPTVYKNIAAQLSVTRNDCGLGTGSAVTYTVPAGTYSSTISQADADNQAQADITKNAQGYANKTGICTPVLIATVQVYSDGSIKKS